VVVLREAGRMFVRSDISDCYVSNSLHRKDNDFLTRIFLDGESVYTISTTRLIFLHMEETIRSEPKRESFFTIAIAGGLEIFISADKEGNDCALLPFSGFGCQGTIKSL
jgi:hypothetical protein